jgi:hypothetical protein
MLTSRRWKSNVMNPRIPLHRNPARACWPTDSIQFQAAGWAVGVA